MRPQRRASVGLDAKENWTLSDPLGRNFQALEGSHHKGTALRKKFRDLGSLSDVTLRKNTSLCMKWPGAPSVCSLPSSGCPHPQGPQWGQSALGEAWGLREVRAWKAWSQAILSRGDQDQPQTSRRGEAAHEANTWWPSRCKQHGSQGWREGPPFGLVCPALVKQTTPGQRG